MRIAMSIPLNEWMTVVGEDEQGLWDFVVIVC